MAITYNGTAITATIYNNSVYRNISYDGGVAYSNTSLCHCTDMSIPVCFGGFERKTCNGCYYLRAKLVLCRYATGCTYLCWVGGKLANCMVDLPLEVKKRDLVTCTCITICGCSSTCGNTYQFPVIHSPITLSATCALCIGACDRIQSATRHDWYGANYTMTSDWIQVNSCDYLSGTICFSGWSIMRNPKLRSYILRYCWQNLYGASVSLLCQVQSTAGCECYGQINTTLC